MDMEKLKQWMDITKQNQLGEFWNFVFDGNEEDAKSLFSEDDFELVEFDENRFPHVDILKTASEITLLVELPGLKKNDVKIALDKNRITIAGSIQKPNEYMLKTERHYGPFSRTIRLPEPTDGRNIIASLEDGLLTITYLRVMKEPQQIKIK